MPVRFARSHRRELRSVAIKSRLRVVSLRLLSVGSILVAAIGAASGAMSAGGCLSLPGCDFEVRGTSASPAGDVVVTAFERACGAVSTVNTKVAVHSGVVAANHCDLRIRSPVSQKGTGRRYNVALSQSPSTAAGVVKGSAGILRQLCVPFPWSACPRRTVSRLGRLWT